MLELIHQVAKRLRTLCYVILRPDKGYCFWPSVWHWSFVLAVAMSISRVQNLICMCIGISRLHRYCWKGRAFDQADNGKSEFLRQKLRPEKGGGHLESEQRFTLVCLNMHIGSTNETIRGVRERRRWAPGVRPDRREQSRQTLPAALTAPLFHTRFFSRVSSVLHVRYWCNIASCPSYATITWRESAISNII